MKGRVLIIAGSDSGGGAGIQADIKAVTALNGFAMTAITALTAQDTQTVHAIHEVPPDFVTRQIAVVAEDLGADCLKTGMLHRTEVLEAVVSAIAVHAPDVPLVADPVMVAKGGAHLLDPKTASAVVELLLPRATLLTPNVPEAEILTGMEISSLEDMRRAGERLLSLGPKAVLMKGGHLEGATVTDLLLEPDGVQAFSSPRLQSRHTHGTGCTLASSIACGIAQGMAPAAAVARARQYVITAIEQAPGFGSGHGPLNHAHTVASK